MATKVGITGVSGFIGSRLHAFLLQQSGIEIIPFSRAFFDEPEKLKQWAAVCDVIVHLAGANKGSGEHIHDVNVESTRKLVRASEEAGVTPHIIFASSIHQDKDTPFGRSKKEGGELLLEWGMRTGGKATSLIIPHVFGESAPPFHNSVVATFCHQLVHEDRVKVKRDAEVCLLYVDALSRIILEIIEKKQTGIYELPCTRINVGELYDILSSFYEILRQGRVPNVKDQFERDLLGALKSYVRKADTKSDVEDWRSEMLEKLDISERLVRVFLNTSKLPKWKNRFSKLLAQPYKYIYHNVFKLFSPKGKLSVPIEVFWGDILHLPLRDENVVTLFFCGSLGLTESRLTRFFIRFLKPDDIFYDIGMNFGFYTALARRCINRGEIHTFEPNPSIIPYLRKNFSNSSRVFLNQAAVADQEGQLDFFDTFESGKSGTSSLRKEAVSNKKENAGVNKTRVLTITLDEYVKTHRPPTVIKLDVEGGETEVLKGAQQTLREVRPIIAMEVSTLPGIKARTQQALKILFENGYKSFRIIESGELEEFNIDLERDNLKEFNVFVFKYIPTI